MGGGDFFLARYFCELFFCESDITCIVTVVGAQKQHKGMFFLKHGGRGANFSNSVMGGDFFPVYSRGGGAQFCHPPPAINNEHSLIEVKSDSHMISRR